MHVAARIELAARYLARGVDHIPGPGAILLETTVRCNLSCPMCPRTIGVGGEYDMPDDVLRTALEQLPAGALVYLYGLGEPLLDRRIFDIVADCKRRGLGTVISTNATLLDSAKAEKLLTCGLDYLIVGLDGVSEETYGYYRAGNGTSLAKTEGNLRHFLALKADRGIGPHVALQFIRMKRNAHETDAFVQRWRNVAGVDAVRIKEEDIGLPEHRVVEPDGELRRNPCHLLYMGPMVVRYNGDVYACYRFAEQGKPVGNVRDTSLPKLWNSPELLRLRGLHAEGQSHTDSVCNSCPCARPRLPLIVGAMLADGVTVRKLVPIAERAALRWRGLLSEPRRGKE